MKFRASSFSVILNLVFPCGGRDFNIGDGCHRYRETIRLVVAVGMERQHIGVGVIEFSSRYAKGPESL